MRYVSLAGNWLLEAVLALKPPKESKRRFLNRCAKRLQDQARVDAELIHKILATGTKLNVPLFVVAVLAKETKCSVQRLLFGTDDVDFEDPNLLTEVDEYEIASANNFATFIEAFNVDFPSILWDYAFPVHRMGEECEIPLTGWIQVYRERLGSDPCPRYNK